MGIIVESRQQANIALEQKLRATRNGMAMSLPLAIPTPTRPPLLILTKTFHQTRTKHPNMNL